VSVPGLSFVGSFGNPWITERIRPNSQILWGMEFTMQFDCGLQERW
jgi:hypothetical protein